MDENPELKLIELALEEWKTTIGVQEHFNTLEMQVRNFAVTVLTAVIGTAAVVYNQIQDAASKSAEAGQVPVRIPSGMILGGTLTAPDMIVMAGLIAWLAFYFMDRWWYHRLLQGAVKHAQDVEDQLKKGPLAAYIGTGLSNSIRLSSPFKLLGVIEIHSDGKIDLFYLTVAVVLVGIIWFVF